jgi:hypothetical protein
MSEVRNAVTADTSQHLRTSHIKMNCTVHRGIMHTNLPTDNNAPRRPDYYVLKSGGVTTQLIALAQVIRTTMDLPPRMLLLSILN